MRSRTLALLAIAVSIPSAWAQGVYKVVGPDGKITYSDQPPGSTSVQYKSAPAAAPAPQPGTANSPVESARPTQLRPSKRAVAGNGGSAAEPEHKPVDPALEGAVIGALGIDDLVRRTEKICTATLPTSFKRYSSAAEGWRSRNADLVTRAHRALADTFDPSARQMIEAGIVARNEATLAVVQRAQAAPRIKWCDKSTDEIANGTMDLRHKQRLSSPLLAYNR